MCVDPLTAAAVASTALSVAGSISAGNAANEAGKANARNLRMQGKQAMDAANMEAGDVRAAARKSAGAIAAQQAANGVALDGGSAMDVAAADAQAFEEDALRALYGGQIRRWNARAEADIKRYEGKVAQRQGYIKAAGTLLSSAASGTFDNLFTSAPKPMVPSGGSNYGTSAGMYRGITPFDGGQ